MIFQSKEPFPGQADDVTGSPYAEEQSEVPDQYKCFLCKGLLRDAVLGLYLIVFLLQLSDNLSSFVFQPLVVDIVFVLNVTNNSF